MKNAKNLKPKSRRWPLSRLKDHPRQAEIFGDLPDVEFQALVADIKKNGVRVPPEILPDGTVILGHQRISAAQQLGWDEIDVIVRHDLEDAGSAAVEELFVNDNLIRRHLTPLAKARCLRRLLELKQGGRGGRISGLRLETLKQDVGANLHLSDRSVNRYLLILETPPVVQAAFDRGELQLTVAGRVALLKKDVQQSIAKRIEAGEPAAKVVAEALARPIRDDDVTRSLKRILISLKTDLPKIEAHAPKMSKHLLNMYLPVIKNLIKVLQRLIEIAE